MPTSPVAEIIPPHNSPSPTDDGIMCQSPESLLVDYSRTDPMAKELDLPWERIAEEDDEMVASNCLETPFQSPVLTKVAINDFASSSPINSPSSSMSGKLIKLFEELSRAEARAPNRAVEASPTRAILGPKLNTNSFLPNIRVSLDGSADDSAGNIRNLAQVDGGNESDSDGLSECF
jgi:hypothetical protein